MLSSGYFKIPRFQRPYSWDRENIQDFWDDVVRDTPADYFIGSMVVYKDGSQRYGVVDGQQRLTTITILLCVLRNALDQNGHKDLAGGIHGLIERKNIDNQSEFVLSTESSYPYFQDRIQRWGAAKLKTKPLKEESNLQAAFEQLTQLVTDVLKSIRQDPSLSAKKRAESATQKLISFRDALLNLKVIFIKLEDEDDAYVIFETLNTRGKDLSLKDLVKNHLVKHLKSKSAAPDSAKLKWEHLLETIEGSAAELETDTFIHHFWLSKYDYLPAKTLFKTLRKKVTANEASGFLDSLVEDASLYRSAQERGYAKWSKDERAIEAALTALTIFRVQQQAPCVLSLLREYKTTRKLKKKHVEQALGAIEKFHFSFTAITSQRSSGGISAMYAALARRLHEVPTTQEAFAVVQELLEKLRDRVPLSAEFEALFPQLVYTDNVTKQKRLVKYVLQKLDSRVVVPSIVDYEQMTIEHIAPQSLIGSGGHSDATVGQIGNLILVSPDLNKKLKDKPFREKKKILTAAGFKLPTELAHAKTWEPVDIAARTALLAKVAYDEVWKI